MGFLKRIFGSSSPDAAGDDAGGPPEDDRPAVTAWVRLLDPEFGNEREEQRVFELENRVIKAIEGAGAGIFDTNELARGSFGMRLLGDDPDRIVELLRPLLADAPAGSYLTIRRGGAGASEERLEIHEPAP
jgi:hypothetical protein